MAESKQISKGHNIITSLPNASINDYWLSVSYLGDDL